jgi:hypothetical protein
MPHHFIYHVLVVEVWISSRSKTEFPFPVTGVDFMVIDIKLASQIDDIVANNVVSWNG